MAINWIYHIDLETTATVEDDVYHDYLESGEWFATPTLARRAAEIADAQLNEPEHVDEIEHIEEVKPAKPREVKANGNSKRADS